MSEVQGLDFAGMKDRVSAILSDPTHPIMSVEIETSGWTRLHIQPQGMQRVTAKIEWTTRGGGESETVQEITFEWNRKYGSDRIYVYIEDDDLKVSDGFGLTEIQKVFRVVYDAFLLAHASASRVAGLDIYSPEILHSASRDARFQRDIDADMAAVTADRIVASIIMMEQLVKTLFRGF